MPGKNLTRDEAAARAALVTVDSYDVELDLTTGPETFSHRAPRSRSRCAEPGAATFIDLIGGSVEAVTLNGEPPRPGHALRRLPACACPACAAENELVVDATGRYTNTGEGLHRFVDPVDDEVYLYTQFEVARLPPDVRRLRAARPQGDASPSPSPRRPTGRSCPTPRRPSRPPARRRARATWHFAPTQPISCYITALVAGPYDVVRDEVHDAAAATVPLGIFCRRVADPSTSTPTTSSTAPSAASRSSRRSSTARTPSRSTTSSSRRSTTWARWRTPAP